MKPQLLKVSTGPLQSFSIRHDVVPYINNRWHYHPEVELIQIYRGEGMQFVGDSIKRFSSGDLLLIGSNLSHYWRFDDVYFVENSQVTADVRVMHFNQNFWGDTFLHLPENKLIQATLERAKRGLLLNGETKQAVGQLLEESLQAEGARRIILLLEMLHLISRCDSIRELASVSYQESTETAEEDRINRIYEYAFANFRNRIETEEIAAVAFMSPNSFCRYFKSKTRKTFSQFIQEIRVGHACKLIREDKLEIKQICFESGFNNLTSFHKYFKNITGKSPLLYQKEFFNKK